MACSYGQDPFGGSSSGHGRQRSQSRRSIRQCTSRSQARYRSPPRSALPSPRGGTSRFQSRYRSTSRYRDRSASPPPREDISSHRLRSRSPPSNYTIETPYERRRRLLAERVMSLETYQRLLRDPKSSWAKLGVVGSTPVPVPLHANETVGDYQQKFEFWLAQRNITLESLQDDVMRERSFRCGYAQWRAQMAENSTSITSYGPQWSGSRSSPWTRDRKRGPSTYRANSRERTVTPHGESQTFSYTDSTRRTTGSYDVHRQLRNDDREKNPRCTNCERKLIDLDRRLKQLESIVARIGVPRGNFFDDTSVSHYERDNNSKFSQEGSAQIFIDLTDNIGIEGNAASPHSESKVDNEPFSVSAQSHPRSVEITPTYSDTNHEGEWETGDADKPRDHAKTDVESPDLAILLNGYNEINDQVLMKEREEKLVADRDVKDMGNSRTATQRSQIYELRDMIDKEKNMRDAAVAAIILYNCVEKENEIGQELLKVVATDDASKQDALHEKCAGIAAKLLEKGTELTRLRKQLQSLSSLVVHGERGDQEAQELSSKIDVERAAKISLETERQKIFSRLMKSSPQIQTMVSEELADKFSTTVEKEMSVTATTSDGKT